MIRKVVPKGKAAQAGVTVGHVLVAIDGRPVKTMVDYLEGRRALAENRKFRLELKRGKKRVEIEITDP